MAHRQYGQRQTGIGFAATGYLSPVSGAITRLDRLEIFDKVRDTNFYPWYRRDRAIGKWDPTLASHPDP